MLEIIEQDRAERRAMYMKLTKAELVEMLMNNQDALSRITPQQPVIPAANKGCVCPPGSEIGCGNYTCPRRNFLGQVPQTSNTRAET